MRCNYLAQSFSWSLYSFACFLYMLQMKNQSSFFLRSSVVNPKMSLCIFYASWLYLPKCSVCNILATEREILCLNSLPLATYSNHINGKTIWDLCGSRRRLPQNYRNVDWKGSLQTSYSYLLLRAEILQSLDEVTDVTSQILKNSEDKDFHIIPR